MRSMFIYRILSISLLLAAIGTGQKPPSGSVQGIVLDDHEQPLPDATVYALPEGDMLHQLRTRTGPEGTFTLDGVPPGGVYVHAYKESAGYPYDFFSFFCAYDRPLIKTHVEAETVTRGVVVRLGARAGRLNIEVTDQDGTPVNAYPGIQLSFDRDDIPGPYRMGARAKESLLIPPVPFRLTVEAQGYEPWKSGVIALKSGGTLDLAVHLRPSTSSTPSR